MHELLSREAPEPAGEQEEDALPRLRLTRPSLPFGLLISLASGLACSLAFPPAGLWPIAFVALVPLLWLIRGRGPAVGSVYGLAFGLGMFGATLWWIGRFGTMAFVALVLAEALAIAVFGALAPAMRFPGRPLYTAGSIAALWTAVEWVRGMWPLGGFTWGSLGVSQVDNRVTLRLASIAGVWGITFVIVAVNVLLVEALAGGGGVGRRWGRVGIALGLMVAPLAIPFPTASGPAMDVATIQVDVRDAQGSAADQDLEVAALNVRAHLGLAEDPPDLAVWGEGALDPGVTSSPEAMRAVQAAVARVGVPTIAGAVVQDADGEHTSALLFGANGALEERYDKIHLVPFGEYVPFRSRLGWVEAIDQVPVDRVPGESAQPLHPEGLPAVGTPICFENAFPAIPRAFVDAGAGLLVVPVNNASYGFSAASAQHLQMSRMRAIETGRWVIDAAISGISAVVDPSGQVTAEAGLFSPAVVRATVRASDARTVYVRLGDWAPLLSVGWVAAAIALPPRRRRVRPAPEPLSPGFRTLVVLPTYDEAATIERVLRGILARPERVDAVVVDDASPDGTADIVRAIAKSEPRVRLVERAGKGGLASAYLEGFRLGLDEGYDLIVEMDSDLSHDPEELSRLLERAAHGEHLVVGSRYVRGGSVTNWSRARVALSRGGNLYARFMLGLEVHDATSGYRAYRRDLLQHLDSERLASDGYGFQIELVLRAWRGGWHVAEVPITFREREHGVSKISRRIVAEALWLVTVWGLRMRFRRGVDPISPDPP